MSQNAKPWHVPGKWFAAPAYWEPEAFAQRKLRRSKMGFIDCTLVEGEDATGCHAGWAARLEIVEALDDLGVQEISLPGGADYREKKDFVRWCRTHGIKARLCAKGPGTHVPLKPEWKDQYKKLIDLGADFIVPIIPGAFDNRRPAIFSNYTEAISMEEMVEAIQEVTAFSKAQGTEVIVSLGDPMRLPTETAVYFSRKAIEAGADGVYVWDSRGNSHPAATAHYVSRIRNAIGDKMFKIQFHNDLGMATANAMVALENGADYIDASILGIGDRGGCVALEEVAAIAALYGIETGIKLEKLYDVCKIVSKAYGKPIDPWKPIAGELWPTEPGWGHTREGDPPETPIGIAPELVGRRFENVIAATVFYGGRYTSFIPDMLRTWGYKHTEADVTEIIERAKSSVMTRRAYMHLSEFQEICKGVLHIN